MVIHVLVILLLLTSSARRWTHTKLWIIHDVDSMTGKKKWLIKMPSYLHLLTHCFQNKKPCMQQQWISMRAQIPIWPHFTSFRGNWLAVSEPCLACHFDPGWESFSRLNAFFWGVYSHVLFNAAGWLVKATSDLRGANENVRSGQSFRPIRNCRPWVGG